MDPIATRFRNLRFEFYSAGRMMMFLGAFSAAPLLLAYALEMALKAGLYKVQEKWDNTDSCLVQSSHKLSGLYSRAQKFGLFTNTYIAHDLFQLAEDHFNLRYPGSLSKLLESKGHVSLDRAKVFSFDDALCQLDDSLVIFSNDPTETMGVQALCHTYSPLAMLPTTEAFFHFNPFTLSRLEQYRSGLAASGLRGHDTGQLDVDALFHHGHSRLGHPGWTFQAARRLLDLRLASLFRYPKSGEPDPDPALIFLQYSPHHMLFYADWVLDRLIEQFGRDSVRIEEDKEKRTIAHVFDRTAKKWWRSLTLVDSSPMFAERWVRNERAEAILEKWIGDTEMQFLRKRRNLKVEPSRQPL